MNVRTYLRKYFRWAWIYFLYWTGLLTWAQSRIRARGGIIVLTLHRVLGDEDFRSSNSPEGMTLRSSSFESLMNFLLKNGDVLSLQDGPPSWDNQNPRNRFVVTFDDGWKDTAEVAAPIAENHQAPITVFICPGLVGQAAPFWPEHAIRAWRFVKSDSRFMDRFAEICRGDGGSSASTQSQEFHSQEMFLSHLKNLSPIVREQIVGRLRILLEEHLANPSTPEVDATMSWDQIINLAKTGVGIGSHTNHHPILTSVAIEEARSEIEVAKMRIESEIRQQCNLFAYPSGAWSWEIRELVAKERHSHAFTTDVGVWMKHTDPLLIPRVNIWEGAVIGPFGQFSRAVFSYTLFWRPYRAELRRLREV